MGNRAQRFAVVGDPGALRLGSAETVESATSIAIANAAPEAAVTGPLAATVNVPFTVEVSADDPSSADLASEFQYHVDWGDGSPVQVVIGAADPPITHTYRTPGSFTASVTATDKDGSTGKPATVTVVSRAAPALGGGASMPPAVGGGASMPPAVGSQSGGSGSRDTPPGNADRTLPRTGSTAPSAVLLGALTLLAGGSVALASFRRRTRRR